jgi:PTH1 family peptidyl-tRNA hydrolase
MKLIIGLGNPGLFYANNRHNIGYTCIRHLGNTHGIRLNKKQGPARTGEGVIEGQPVTLARSQTYMNESGLAVQRLLARLNLAPGDLIVIHDDLDLPLGKIRLRYGGSSGGHKGINSIIDCIGSNDFYRVKVGISRPDNTGDAIEKEKAVIDYVLSGFNREEKKIVKEVVTRVEKAIICLLTEGLETAMNKYN